MTNARQNGRRNGRKDLDLKGLMFIGGIACDMYVQNLSNVGVLVFIETSLRIHDAHDVFLLIKKSSVVDIFIEQLNLAGKTEVVRVEMEGQHILMGLEFKQISYDTDNFLHQFKTSRKSMTVLGQLLIGKNTYEFMTRNISVEGLIVCVSEYVVVKTGMFIEFKFDKLHLQGEAKIIWFEHDDNEGTLLGLEYQHMEKGDIKGIIEFYH